MRQRSRLTAAVFALLHLTVAGLGPLADARLEASEREFSAHIESEQSRPCAQGHDHLFCQLCRVIGVGGRTASAPVAIQVPRTPRPLIHEFHSNTVTRFTLASHGPRAPPVA